MLKTIETKLLKTNVKSLRTASYRLLQSTVKDKPFMVNKILDTPIEKPQRKATHLEKPELDKNSACKIQKILALNVSYNLITWLMVNNEGSILNWSVIKLENDDNTKKSSVFEDEYEDIKTIFEDHIPHNCQAYIFEARRYKAHSLKLVPYVIQISRSELMLQCIIKDYFNNGCTKNSCDPEEMANVYSLNQVHVSKRFRTLVGNEHTMSTTFLDEVLRMKKSGVDELLLNESDRFTEFWDTECREKAVRESIAKNYLQAACFVNRIRNVKFFEQMKGED